MHEKTFPNLKSEQRRYNYLMFCAGNPTTYFKKPNRVGINISSGA